MTWRPFESEDPDRFYTITGGRSRSAESSLDLVTLIVGECDPVPGMQSEHVRILRLCRQPVAVVEISADLGLPVSIVKILLCDLLDSGQITARHPAAAPTGMQLPDPETLKQVLIGLQNL